MSKQASFSTFAAGREAEHVYMWTDAWAARIPATSKMGAALLSREPVPPVPARVTAIVAAAERQCYRREADDFLSAEWLIKTGTKRVTSRMKSDGLVWTAQIADVNIAADLATNAGAIAQAHGGGEIAAFNVDIGLRLPGLLLSGCGKVGWSIVIAPLSGASETA